jgi:adenosylcobinamide kinase/adenosylcobinamide-phosphate guanylyltransferase
VEGRTVPLILIGGGARSGKTTFALARARELGGPRVYLATAELRREDGEMVARIERHQAERPDFTTVEEPFELARVLGERQEVVLVDCLTLWLSNLLCADLDDAAVEARFAVLLQVLAERQASTILVTNEVGLGIVPENALARRFRDHAGRLHQRLAAVADEVWLGAMGLLLRLHPAPVEARRP